MRDIGGSAQLENNLDFPMASPALRDISHPLHTDFDWPGRRRLGTMWAGETAQALLEQAGFAWVERRLLAHRSDERLVRQRQREQPHVS